MKRRKSILQIAAGTLSILLITEGISGVPAIAFAADKDLVGEAVIDTYADEAVIEAEVDGEVVEAKADEAVVEVNAEETITPNGAIGDDNADYVVGANTVIDRIGMEGYDAVTDDGMELYTAFVADMNLEIQGGKYFKGHEILNFGDTDIEVYDKENYEALTDGDDSTDAVQKAKPSQINTSMVFALNEIPVEMSDNYMLFVPDEDPEGEDASYLEKVKGTALYAWEYEKQTDGTYKRVRSVPISGEDFTINDENDTMYVNLYLGHIDTDKRSFDDLNTLGTYSAPKIYSYLSDNPDLKKDNYPHVPTLSGLVRLDGSKFKNSSNPIAIAALCYDATTTPEEDLYTTEPIETTGGHIYHDYSWDNNKGFALTFAISDECYYYGRSGEVNYTKYWSDEPYYASKMGSFSLQPYKYRFTDTETEHTLTLYNVYPYSLFVRRIEQYYHVDYDNWKDKNYSTANLPIGTWKIPATYTDPMSGTTYKVRIAKGGNIVPQYASKLIIEDGVGFPEDCSYLFSSLGNINLRSLSEIVIEGNAKTVGSNITNMSYMFLGKKDRQGFDATEYTSLDFAALDTSNVTDMSFMFADVTMTNRANIDVTTLDTSNVTNFKGMFRSYHVPSGLYQPATALDLSHFDTAKAENMSEMFEGSTVSALDLSDFDFSKVTDMSRMFTSTEYLESITFPSDMDSSNVTDMSFMFAGDDNLMKINNITAMDTGNVTDMSGMFGAHTCMKKQFETIPVDVDPDVYTGSYLYDKIVEGYNGYAVFKPAWVPLNNQGLYQFYSGPAITSLDLTGFDTRKVKYANGMFNMPALTEIKWGTHTTFESLSDAGGMFTLASVKKLDLTGRKFSNIKFACSEAFPIEMFNLNKATELVLGEDSINLLNLSSKGQLMINAPMLYSLDLRKVGMGTNALMGEGALYYGSPSSLQDLPGLYEIYLPAGMPVLASPAELPGTFYDDAGEAYTVINGGYENELHLVNPEAEATEDKVTVSAVVLNKTDVSLYPGETLKLSATVSPANAMDKSVRWSSSDTDKARVDDIGEVVAVAAGTATITATANGGAFGTTVKAECTVTVLPSEIVEKGDDDKPITPAAGQAFVTEGDGKGEAKIWVAGLNNTGYYYTGNAIKPEIHVYKGYKLLMENTDYTLSFMNNKNVSNSIIDNKKKPQIIIKMKGEYSGSETVYFNIIPMPLDKLTADNDVFSVEYKAGKKNLLKPNLMYNGNKVKYGAKDIAFKWFATDENGTTTNTESECINAGTYAVKVFAGESGNCSNEAGHEVARVIVTDKIPMSKVKLTGFKGSLPYAQGKAVFQNTALTYKDNGGTITLSEKNAANPDGDYTVKYENNYDLGIATVTYEAAKDESGKYTGRYSGKVIKSYKITGKYTLSESGDGKNCTVSLNALSYPYANAAIKPEVKVTATITNNNGIKETRTLVQGKDYTLSYKNNKAVAAADAEKNGKDAAPQVIIKGKGSYLFADTEDMKKGIVKRFEITKPSLGSLVLTISDMTYNKSEDEFKKTKILFTDKDYRDLKLKINKDYTAEFATSDGSRAPAAGQVVTVTLTATSNSSYTGSVTGSYRITDNKIHTDISKTRVVINPNANGKTQPCTYTGSGIEPGQTGQPGLGLTIGSGKNLKTLTLKTVDGSGKISGDYEIIGYYNNVLPGNNAVILIRGIGNYRGIRAVKFKISSRGVNSRWGGVYGQN